MFNQLKSSSCFLDTLPMFMIESVSAINKVTILKFQNVLLILMLDKIIIFGLFFFLYFKLMCIVRIRFS
jgi:hypothetical protein